MATRMHCYINVQLIIFILIAWSTADTMKEQGCFVNHSIRFQNDNYSDISFQVLVLPNTDTIFKMTLKTKDIVGSIMLNVNQTYINIKDSNTTANSETDVKHNLIFKASPKWFSFHVSLGSTITISNGEDHWEHENPILIGKDIVEIDISDGILTRNCHEDCGAEYNSSSGTIRHPSSGYSYTNYEACAWTIRAATAMIITFTKFDTQSGSDYLYIRDGLSNGSPMLGNFTGRSLPSPIFTSTNTASLHFTSDGYGVGYGFQLQWDLLKVSYKELESSKENALYHIYCLYSFIAIFIAVNTACWIYFIYFKDKNKTNAENVENIELDVVLREAENNGNVERRVSTHIYDEIDEELARAMISADQPQENVQRRVSTPIYNVPNEEVSRAMHSADQAQGEQQPQHGIIIRERVYENAAEPFPEFLGTQIPHGVITKETVYENAVAIQVSDMSEASNTGLHSTDPDSTADIESNAYLSPVPLAPGDVSYVQLPRIPIVSSKHHTPSAPVPLASSDVPCLPPPQPPLVSSKDHTPHAPRLLAPGDVPGRPPPQSPRVSPKNQIPLSKNSPTPIGKSPSSTYRAVDP